MVGRTGWHPGEAARRAYPLQTAVHYPIRHRVPEGTLSLAECFRLRRRSLVPLKSASVLLRTLSPLHSTRASLTNPAFPAFAPPPAIGIQRNSVKGPGYNDVDASLTKAFGFPNTRALGERTRLEFRVDAYNLFNKLNLEGQSIDNTLGSANPDGTVTSTNSDFGVTRNALGSRTVQLQSRFSF
ncbi:MAG: hypothetical protein ACLP00_05190 [Terracidiphilus sp.]